MIQFLTQKILSLQTLGYAIIGLLALYAVAKVWAKTQAVVPTVTTIVLAGFVMWAVKHFAWFETKVGQEAGYLVPVGAGPLINQIRHQFFNWSRPNQRGGTS